VSSNATPKSKIQNQESLGDTAARAGESGSGHKMTMNSEV